jgi:hypothetical protein
MPEAQRSWIGFMSTTEIERRLIAVERQLSHLAERVNASPAPQNMNGSIDQIHDTFQNDASYRQAARLGRQWRKSHRTIRRRGRTEAG